MTELLQQAIAAIQQLPIEQQDAMVEDRPEVIASRFLAEIQDEKAWQTRFDSTTDRQWDDLAAMLRQEIKAGDLIPLGEVFPTN
jgi:uncharacterized protein YllA (UPF0747 family)